MAFRMKCLINTADMVSLSSLEDEKLVYVESKVFGIFVLEVRSKDG